MSSKGECPVKKLVVSVCMMVKNEEKNLARCLDSLQPLLAKLPSEIVIIDTGSEDKTVEIAKKYTERVYFHAWNNHFSEMRNISIGYAKGEWVMIIDADEQLDNPEGVIDFLETKQPKQIAAGALLVKNLTNEDLGKSVSFLSPRIFRRTKGLCYQGAVHNVPVINGAIVDTESSLWHYGYMTGDKELMEQKFIRTSTLLKEQLAKDPDNLYYRYQLAVSYAMHEDWAEALPEIWKVYDRNRDDEKTLKLHVYLFGTLLFCYANAGVFGEAGIEAGEHGLRLEPEYVDLYFFLAQLHVRRNENDKAFVRYKEYLGLLRNFSNLQIRMNLNISHYTLGGEIEALHNMAVICYQNKKYAEAREYVLEVLNIDDKADVEVQRARILLLNLDFAENKFTASYDIYTSFVENQQYVEAKLFEAEAESRWKKAEDKVRHQYCQTFLKTPGLYGVLNEFRLNRSKGKKLLTKLQGNDINQLPEYYAELILAQVLIPEDDTLWQSCSEQNLLIYMGFLSLVYPEEFFSKAKSYVMDMAAKKGCGFWENRTIKNITKYLLFSGELKSNEYMKIFHIYMLAGTAFLRGLYSEVTILEERLQELKNVEEAFLLYLEKMQRSNELPNKIKYLGNALAVYPDMHAGINLLIEELENEQRPSGMENLLSELIEQINILIKNGRFEEALCMIQEGENVVGKNARLLLLTTDIYCKQSEVEETKK